MRHPHTHTHTEAKNFQIQRQPLKSLHHYQTQTKILVALCGQSQTIIQIRFKANILKTPSRVIAAHLKEMSEAGLVYMQHGCTVLSHGGIVARLTLRGVVAKNDYLVALGRGQRAAG